MPHDVNFQVRDIESDNEWQQACALLQEVYVGDGYTTLANASEFIKRERFESQSQAIIAMNRDGQVVGVVLLLNRVSSLRQIANGDEREFRMLGVANSARGEGVGQALVQACIDRVHATDAVSLVLWTQPTMLAAHRLYERLGFVRDPSRDEWDDRGFTRLVYVRGCVSDHASDSRLAR